MTETSNFTAPLNRPDTPHLEELRGFLEKYNQLHVTITNLQQSVEQLQAKKAAIEADQTGDPSTLAKQAAKLKQAIDEGESEILIWQARIPSTAAALEAPIAATEEEARRVDQSYANQRQASFDSLLDDPVTLQGIKQLKAAIELDNREWVLKHFELNDIDMDQHRYQDQLNELCPDIEYRAIGRTLSEVRKANTIINHHK